MLPKENKVLVIGANGMLGFTVSKYFKRKNYLVTSLIRKHFNIAKDTAGKLTNYVKGTDFIVNCAGVIKPRIKTTPMEEILKVNSIFPHNLAKLCRQYHKPCFHITTDCVYSGEKGSYSEEDFYDVEDIYGLSKACGDTPECMTLRTSIIGEEENYKYSLLEWLKKQKGKKINGFVNHKWNGVTTLYLAEIIKNIITSGFYRKGIFHIFSSETVTKYKLALIINDVYKLNLKIVKYKTPQKCDRSLSTIYSLCKKIVKKPLLQQIEELKTFSKK